MNPANGTPVRWLRRAFLLWIALVYAGVLWLLPQAGGLAAVAAHWPVALVMVFGSFLAGSLPMGGGTVAFPLLVLVFGQPPAMGRDFSFAVQSLGMTSATLWVLAQRPALPWRFLGAAVTGAVLGVPLGLGCIAPLLPPLAVKCLFATAWAGFGVFHLYRTAALAAQQAPPQLGPNGGRVAGFAIGLLAGALLSAVTGVGSDLAVYSALVLLGRSDLRLAIPSAILVMAATSIVGLCTQLGSGRMSGELLAPVLAAAPIVVLGAPLGARVIRRVGRKPTLRLVAGLCVLQFAWLCLHEAAALGPLGLALVLAGVAVAVLVCEALRRAGLRGAGAHGIPPRP